jgi:hypothetical protein
MAGESIVLPPPEEEMPEAPPAELLPLDTLPTAPDTSGRR